MCSAQLNVLETLVPTRPKLSTPTTALQSAIKETALLKLQKLMVNVLLVASTAFSLAARQPLLQALPLRHPPSRLVLQQPLAQPTLPLQLVSQDDPN
jgi:hypothetical protein